MIKQSLERFDFIEPQPVRLHCPFCGALGSFEQIRGSKDLRTFVGADPSYITGLRQCPNPRCKGLVICIWNRFDTLLETVPPQIEPFNPTGVPDRVRDAFCEALICSAQNCYVASAMLLRKTLEEICNDQSAIGANLKMRIEALRTLVTLPVEVFDAMHNLRFLGNDAAHIESKTYDVIGRNQLKAGIAFTKMLINLIYQYSETIKLLEDAKVDDEGTNGDNAAGKPNYGPMRLPRSS